MCVYLGVSVERERRPSFIQMSVFSVLISDGSLTWYIVNNYFSLVVTMCRVQGQGLCSSE